MGALAITVTNQWAATFSQPAVFGNMPPALQSVVVPLAVSNSVGGGSGTSTAGNWLFCLVTSNQNDPMPAVTFGDGDDIHSWWRPVPTTSASGLTRTSVWYTPNLARQAGYVYVAPGGICGAISVLVVEVSGLGPWDTVTGVSSNFANAATSLSLALAAPSAQAFLIGVVGGDNSTVTQTFLPATWTGLHTVTATNGTDHTSDSVLTAACLTTSGSVSVSASASSAVNLSGLLIGVLTSAPSPITGTGIRSNWAGRTILEFAPGAGFQTPPDQITWVTLNDSALGRSMVQRFWSWSDKSSIPYGLGQFQSSSGSAQLDNFDGNLSPSWPGSLWYSNALNSNMSFQSRISPWAANNGGTISQSSAFAFASSPAASALYSMQLHGNGTTAQPGALSEQVPVTANAFYSASAWFYSPSSWASGVQVGFNWYTSGGTYISSTGFVSSGALAAGTWTQVTSLNVQAPGTAAFGQLAVLALGTPTAGQMFYVAEAALVAGSAAVTTGLLTAGVPIRLRMALGTYGGVTYNRWYCISRNITSWSEKRTPKTYRSYVEAGLTDAWSTASASCPTPYRGEIENDSPHDWWPMDDQPLAGGVQPGSLDNAASGNSTLMSIIASPSGVSATDAYSTTGTDLTVSGLGQTAPASPSVATSAVAQLSGWMYGDPPSSPQSAQSGNPAAGNPGSAAWQQQGLLGNTGTQTWFLAANDTTFPPLSGGVTVKGWFRAGLLGSTQGYTSNSNARSCIAAQPFSQITIATLSTSSAPVAILYLDTSGHLILQTFVGTTGTNHTIYSTSDLRNGAWISVDILLTTTTYRVLVNGGLTADVSGTMSAATSAWTWLTLNGDYGTTHGGSSPSSIQHGGNVAYSHWAVFGAVLPKWRLLSHYNAAITGYGLLPAPQSLSLSAVANEQAGTGYTPDGTEFQGSYGGGGLSVTSYTFSAIAVAQAGSYTSGPSSRVINAGFGVDNAGTFYGNAMWLGLNALAPSVVLYNAASAAAETSCATICGEGDTFTSGFGASASGHGTSQTAAGSGASPPAAASSLGDTVQQRLERILGYGGLTVPMRAIDAASQLVQAATDIGGQQTGANVTNIVGSDNGWWFTDNMGLLCYRSRPHLNTDTAVWQLGPNTAGGQIPYDAGIGFRNDQQRVFTALSVAPFSPDGLTLANLVPSNAAAVAAAQDQYGARPMQVTSYLQSSSEQQAQVNWLFSYYGTMRRGVEVLSIDAATHPAAWGLVAGANMADVTQVYDQPFSAPVTQGTYRISSLARSIAGGANGNATSAKIQLVIDPVPVGGYWS